MATENIDFPVQLVSEKKKNTKWYQDCVEKAIKLTTAYNHEGVRFSRAEKLILYALGVDEVDPRDMAKTFNPYGIEDLNESFKDIRNFPFEQGGFTALKGEAIQRPYNYQVKLTNPEAVSELNAQKKELLVGKIQEMVLAENLEEDEAKAKLDRLIDDLYDFRDIKAIKAKKLLDKIEVENDFEKLFQSTFESSLYVGEAISFFEIVNGNLKVQHVNDLNLFVISPGNTNKIQDSEIIVYVDYMNTSQIISYFREDLTKADLTALQDNSSKPSEHDYYPSYVPAAPTVDENGYQIDELVFESGSDTGGYGPLINETGDYRVVRVFWKGKKQAMIVQSIDDAGNLFEEIQDGNYEIREDLGEVKLDDIWLDVWEEGVQIRGDIYTRMKPWEGVVYSKLDFSLRTHPFIGYVNTLNGIAPVSLMSKIKNLKYLYNVLRKELELSIGKNMGNVAEIDMAYMPKDKGWTMDKYIYYMKASGLKFVDSLNKTEEGNYISNNTTGKTINLSQYDHIQSMNAILDQIKMEVGEITGITPQRLGQVSNRETKGGIERSVLQSSNATEPWFKLHDMFKKDVYTNSLEMSKVWVEGSLVPITDFGSDALQLIDEIDGDEFSMWDYGIYITDSAKDLRLKGIIEELSGPLLQAQVLPYSDYLHIMANDDMTQSMNILKRAERNKDRKEDQLRKEQGELQQQEFEFEKEKSQLEFEREMMLKDKDAVNSELIQRLKNENALEIAEIEQENKNASLALEQERVELDKVKAASEKDSKNKELQIKDKDVTLKNKNKPKV